jgi:hypothetical protein
MSPIDRWAETGDEPGYATADHNFADLHHRPGNLVRTAVRIPRAVSGSARLPSSMLRIRARSTALSSSAASHEPKDHRHRGDRRHHATTYPAHGKTVVRRCDLCPLLISHDTHAVSNSTPLSNSAPPGRALDLRTPIATVDAELIVFAQLPSAFISLHSPQL